MSYQTPWLGGSVPPDSGWQAAAVFDPAQGHSVLHHLSLGNGQLAGWSSARSDAGELLVAIAWSGNIGVAHNFSSGLSVFSGQYSSGAVGVWPGPLRGYIAAVHLWQEYQIAARGGELQSSVRDGSVWQLRFPTSFGPVEVVLDVGSDFIHSFHRFNGEGQPVEHLEAEDKVLHDGHWVPSRALIRYFGRYDGVDCVVRQNVELQWNFSVGIRPEDVVDLVEVQNTISAFGRSFHRIGVFDEKMMLNTLQMRVQGEKIGIPVLPAAPEVLEEERSRRRPAGKWSSQAEAMSAIRDRLREITGKPWNDEKGPPVDPGATVASLLRRFRFVNHELDYCGQAALACLAQLGGKKLGFKQLVDAAGAPSLSVAEMIALGRDHGVDLEAVACTADAIVSAGVPFILVRESESRAGGVGHATAAAFSEARDRVFVFDGPESVQRQSVEEAVAGYQMMLVPRAAVAWWHRLVYGLGLAAAVLLACFFWRHLRRRSRALPAVICCSCLVLTSCGRSDATLLSAEDAVFFERPEYETWVDELYQAVAIPIRVVNTGQVEALVKIDAPSCSCLSVADSQRSLRVPAHDHRDFTAHITASTDRSVVVPARIVGTGQVITTTVNVMVGNGILIEPAYLVCDQRPTDGLLPQMVTIRVIRDPLDDRALRVISDAESCTVVLGGPATKPLNGGRWVLDVYRARVHVGAVPAGGYKVGLSRRRADGVEVVSHCRVYVR